MEPATTQVWAEMLTDRKFLNEINSKPDPPARTGLAGGGRNVAGSQYPQKQNLFKAMKKVDPTIQVIASSATPEELSWGYIENRQLGTLCAARASGVWDGGPRPRWTSGSGYQADGGVGRGPGGTPHLERIER